MLLDEKILEILSQEDDVTRQCSNIFTENLSISGSVSTKNYVMIDILYHLLKQEFEYPNINFELYKNLNALLNVIVSPGITSTPEYPNTTTTPQVTVSDLDPITFSNTIINTNSSVETLTFSATNLTGNLVISCDSMFYISLDPYSGFSQELFFPVSNGINIPDTSIYIRFSPTTIASHTGTLTFSTAGVLDIDINLSGDGISTSIPTILTNVSYLTKFAATLPDTISLEEQSYIITASNLTANLVVTPPTDFEISLTSGSGFTASPITIIPTGGAVSSTIYVRFHPTQLKFYNARISNTSTGASSKYVVVQGTGSENTSLLDSAASSTTDGFLKHEDWIIFSNKQNQLNGTGFVKVTGTTITYDPATYQAQLNGTGFVVVNGTTVSYDNTPYAPYSHIGTGGSAHSVATESESGFMSAADKTRLDNVAIIGEVPGNVRMFAINRVFESTGDDTVVLYTPPGVGTPAHTYIKFIGISRTVGGLLDYTEASHDLTSAVSLSSTVTTTLLTTPTGSNIYLDLSNSSINVRYSEVSLETQTRWEVTGIMFVINADS